MVEPKLNLLDGLKVLDFSRMVAGPYLTAMLADLGAEVIKIERPGQGDDMRHIAPMVDGQSYEFMMLNRGKQSVTLDLKKNEGRNIALELIRHADVLVENFRPGVASRLGIGYDAAQAVNKAVVYVSVSGFGQSGPLSVRPAYDHIAQAMGGIMSINGMPDGPPTRVGESIADVVAGIFGAWGTVAALFDRERTGQGRHVDVAMVDSVVSLLVTALASYFATGNVPGRVGNAHPVSAPLDAFKTRDGFVIIAVANNTLFHRLSEVLGDEHLASDPRFESDELRKQHETELKEHIERWTSTRTVADVERTLSDAMIPVAPVLDIAQVVSSAHVHFRGILNQVEHPDVGTVTIPRQPVMFSLPNGEAVGPPPRLGEHTVDVLKKVLGLDESEIQALSRDLVI